MAAELAPIRAEIDAAIARVVDSGVFVGGPEVAAFEAELAAAVGAAHAVGTSSGTDALLAIGMALGIGPGDEVVTTPLSFFATAGAFARLGARLVFADIDEAALTLDPRAALAACSDRTRAIVPVHLFGRPAELPAAPCAIIEDAAQSIGAGPALGGPGPASSVPASAPPRGVAAAMSFFPTKTVGALGDAGAVVTDDAALAERVAMLRVHGAKPRHHHVAIGGNFRLDALQAAVLRVKLVHLAARLAARRARAATYRRLFASARIPPELRLPTEHAAHTYHQFAIRAPRRDALRAYLADAGVGTEIYYPSPLHFQPCFASLGYRAGSLPNAERACTDVLALPIQSPDAAAQAYVVAQIEAFYRG